MGAWKVIGPGRGGAGSSVHVLQKHEEGHISTYNEQRGLREACVCSLRNNQKSSGEPGRVCRGGQEYGEHEPPKVCVLSGQTKAMNEGVKMGGLLHWDRAVFDREEARGDPGTGNSAQWVEELQDPQE